MLYQHPVKTAQSLLYSVQEAIFNIHRKREVSCVLWDEDNRPSQKHNSSHGVEKCGFHKAHL